MFCKLIKFLLVSTACLHFHTYVVLSQSDEYYYQADAGLTIVPFTIPITTTHLLLNGNSFSSISTNFSGLNSLVEVYLNDNEISFIHPDAFLDSASTLTKLNLTNNLLTSFPELNNLELTLTHFYLARNIISSLSFSSTSGLYDAVTHFDFSDNPLPWTTAAGFTFIEGFGLLVEIDISGTDCIE